MIRCTLLLASLIAVTSCVYMIGKADEEFTGATCAMNQNCGTNCVTDRAINVFRCSSGMNHYVCQVAGSGDLKPIPYKVCVRSDQADQTCSGKDPGDAKVSCKNVKVWLCYCLKDDDVDGGCNLTTTPTCTCSGDADQIEQSIATLTCA